LPAEVKLKTFPEIKPTNFLLPSAMFGMAIIPPFQGHRID